MLHVDGKLHGLATQVSISNGSVTDFGGTLNADASVDKLNTVLRLTSARGNLLACWRTAMNRLYLQTLWGPKRHAPLTRAWRWTWATWSRSPAGTTTNGATPTASLTSQALQSLEPSFAERWPQANRRSYQR